jgi:ubiquitin C-terminal hydrolase
MASLLPAVHGGAPILAMSGGSLGGSMGGSMSDGGTLLPLTHGTPHIAPMSGGASLLPLVDADIHAMRGGGVDAASFGIKSLRNEVAIPHDPPCSPLTGDKTKICESLRPFVDRRVQALLARIERFTPINERVDMGCGTIERKGEKLTIRFHRNAITLLSGDLTGTFAEFRKGKPLHMPQHDTYKGIPLQNTVSSLLQWMIGSHVDETGSFDLVQFMNTMTPLPISGFRMFLSYHKENVIEEDVYRYAMELYGYKTTHYADMMNIYGWIFPPDICIRREGSQWAVNTGGKVKLYDTKEAALPTKRTGITVCNPTAAILKDPAGFIPPPMATSTPLTGSSLVSSPASVASVASAASAAPLGAMKPVAIPSSTGSLAAPASEKYEADKAYLISALQSKHNSVDMKRLEILNREDPQEISNAVDAIKRARAAKYVSRKIVDKVEIPDRQQIGGKHYNLRGMIYHDGTTLSSGHYIYYYHDPSHGWYQYNDSRVYPINGQPDEIDDGYVYLFENGNEPIALRHRGIVNPVSANVCWMNSSIQMFYHIPEYRTYIESFTPESYRLPPDIVEKTMIIQRIFHKYSTHNSDSITCIDEHRMLHPLLFSGSDMNSQQDPMEFINMLLQIIDPLSAFQKEQGNFEDHPITTALYNLFKIVTYSMQQCDNPLDTSRGKDEALTSLSLSIPPSRDLTLQSLLDYYIAPSNAGTYTLNDTPCNNEITATTHIHQTNKYIIIRIKRYEGRLAEP